tara:strand:- start:6262 stop:7980 length:1719 start_codon:yes stop_codon:yes gene_type:complete
MARMLDEEYYNVSRNILDKVGEDSPVDSDALKGLAAYFGLDVLRRLVDRKDNVMAENIANIKNDEVVKTGRNQELWKRRGKVLDNNKLINEQGAERFFDAQAESVFKNPKTHENSDILKENPDWTFNPDEFEDRNSPMYKVKQDWKRDYINQVLLPQHKNKFDQIDQNILTFDEYNTNNRELTKHAIEYAKRPEERSILRQWNLFGKKRTAKLKEKYDTSKKAQENILLEREGYLIGNYTPQIFAKDPETGDTFGSTLEGTKKFQDNIVRPLSGLTRKMYETGEVYNTLEFRNTQEFKKLSIQGQKLALDLFNQNEEYGDKNNTYEILNIFTSVQLLENEQNKIRKYDSIKYNDPDFVNAKPQRQKNQTRSMYESSQAYQQWKTTVDAAYTKGSIKDVQAKQTSGYDITRSDEINLAIEDNIEYIAELRENKRQLDENKITQDEYNKKIEDFKENTISNIIEKELGTTDKIQSYVDGMQEDRMNLFLKSLYTPAGQDEMDRWYVNLNAKREQSGLNPIPPSSKLDLYRLINTKHILDDSAFLLDTLIINPSTGKYDVDPEELTEYNISTDSL